MPQNNRPPRQPYQNSTNANSRRRQKQARRKRITSLIVLFVLVIIMFFIAILFSHLGSKPQSVPSIPSFSQPVSSAPSAAPSSSKAEKQTFGNPADPYYVEGAPPLFNRNHEIPQEYYNAAVANLAALGDGYQLQAPAAEAFLAMQQAAANEGISLYPVSAFRSYDTQVTNYNNAKQNYLWQGYSESEAIRLTEEYYAIPGTSEHEAGLAVDVNSIEESFEQTSTFVWLQAHCAEYGFILRYPKDKVDITAIAYEPWHYRYVGSNHAEAMKTLGITTLEEYTDYLNE